MTAGRGANVGRGGRIRKWTAANSGGQRRTWMEVDFGRRRRFVGDVRVSIMGGCLFHNVFFCLWELPVACIFLPANLPVAPAKTNH
jgi:hypothetical protein